MSMSEQLDQTEQSAMTPQELRQHMLEELEASKQAIEELSDEELEAVAGGGFSTIITRGYAVTRQVASGLFHDKTLQAGVAGASASGLVMGTNKLRGGKG